MERAAKQRHRLKRSHAETYRWKRTSFEGTPIHELWLWINGEQRGIIARVTNYKPPDGFHWAAFDSGGVSRAWGYKPTAREAKACADKAHGVVR